jgi:hypothetical protein
MTTLTVLAVALVAVTLAETIPVLEMSTSGAVVSVELVLLEDELESEQEVKLLSLASEGLSPTLPEPRTQPSSTGAAFAVKVAPLVTAKAATSMIAIAANLKFFIRVTSLSCAFFMFHI